MVDGSGRSIERDLDRLRRRGALRRRPPRLGIADRVGARRVVALPPRSFSVSEIIGWSQHTNVYGISARAIDRPPPFISAIEVASRAGVDLETVVDFRAAVGLPVAEPEAATLPETVVTDVQAFLLGCELYGREESLAFARVLGWAATRVMEAGRAMFGGSVARMGDAARTELQLAKRNEEGIVAWTQVQSVSAAEVAPTICRPCSTDPARVWARTDSGACPHGGCATAPRCTERGSRSR